MPGGPQENSYRHLGSYQLICVLNVFLRSFDFLQESCYTPASTCITLKTYILTQEWVLLKTSALLLLATAVPVFQYCCWDCLLWVLLVLSTLIIKLGVNFVVVQRRR